MATKFSRYEWHPSTLDRNLKPFLEENADDDSLQPLAEQTLEAIRQDPWDPPFPVVSYRGFDLRPAYVAIQGRLWIRYQILRDYPYILLVNILDWGTGGQPGIGGPPGSGTPFQSEGSKP